ncbi:MAG: DUF4905 domain-containing protein [Ignavibacteria bacterium]
MELLKKNKLHPHWIFSQSGNLWRFIFAREDTIVGETRDIDKRLLYLFSLNIITGEIFLKDYMFEDGNYWISIESGNADTIFLNRYQQPDLPYHKNIVALDIKTGSKKWENEEYLYFHHTENEVYAYRQLFEDSEFVRLDIATGKLIEILEPDKKSKIYKIRDNDDEILYSDVIYANELSSNNPDGNIRHIIDKEVSNTNIGGDIEYIVYNNFLVFNYYEKIYPKNQQSSLENRLRIFDIPTEKKLYADILNYHSAYKVPDNFLVYKNVLLYLRNKKEIVAIKLEI